MFHLMYQRKKHTIILNTEMIKMLDDVYLGIFTNELHFLCILFESIYRSRQKRSVVMLIRLLSLHLNLCVFAG